MRARAELRTRLAALLSLALIVGVIGGVVIGAAAGARRTNSAYDRFIRASGSPNALVGSRSPGDLERIIPKVRSLPQVAEAAVISHPVVDATSERGRELFDAGLSVFWTPFEHPGSRWFRPKVVAGRLPDPGRADEAAVAYKAGS